MKCLKVAFVFVLIGFFHSSLFGYEKTPFEHLQDLYTYSQGPAELPSFDQFGKASNMKCAGALKTSKEVTEMFPMKVHSFCTKKKGGPEFPVKCKTVLVSSQVEDSISLADAIAEKTQINATTTDLVLSIDTNDAATANLPATTYFRRNGNYITVKSGHDLGKPSEDVFYAYCWREGKSPSIK